MSIKNIVKQIFKGEDDKDKIFFDIEYHSETIKNFINNSFQKYIEYCDNIVRKQYLKIKEEVNNLENNKYLYQGLVNIVSHILVLREFEEKGKLLQYVKSIVLDVYNNINQKDVLNINNFYQKSNFDVFFFSKRRDKYNIHNEYQLFYNLYLSNFVSEFSLGILQNQRNKYSDYFSDRVDKDIYKKVMEKTVEKFYFIYTNKAKQVMKQYNIVLESYILENLDSMDNFIEKIWHKGNDLNYNYLNYNNYNKDSRQNGILDLLLFIKHNISNPIVFLTKGYFNSISVDYDYHVNKIKKHLKKIKELVDGNNNKGINLDINRQEILNEIITNIRDIGRDDKKTNNLSDNLSNNLSGNLSGEKLFFNSYIFRKKK